MGMPDFVISFVSPSLLASHDTPLKITQNPSGDT